MKVKGLLIGLVVVGLFLGGCATVTKIPLPSDLNIEPPAKDLPESIRSLSGRWEGRWNGFGQFIIIVVEKIDKERAQVVRAWEGRMFQPSATSCYEPPGWIRKNYQVSLKEDVLLSEENGGFRFLKNSSILKGWSVYRSKGVEGIKMKKIE